MEYQAIVLAAGNSTRANLTYNKILHKVGEQPIIFYSVNNFILDKDCKNVIVVYNEKDLSELQKVFSTHEKVVFVLGGNTRQESVNNALSYITCDYTIIHDGARPYFTNNLLVNLKEKLKDFNAVIPVVDSIDTVKVIKDNIVVKTLKRDEIKRVQTPQGFKTNTIKKAHQLAKHNLYTDDSSMVEELLDEKVYVIDGEVNNIKYTNKEDF